MQAGGNETEMENRSEPVDETDENKVHTSSSHDHSQKVSTLRKFSVFWIPFLAFRDSREMDLAKYIPIRAILNIVIRLISLWRKPSKKSMIPPLFEQALLFIILMVSTKIGVFFIVIVCFSFSASDEFPNVGESLGWMLLGRAILMIVVLETVCLDICYPNMERLKMLTLDMTQIYSRFSYTGVIHTFRKITAFLTRQTFTTRWFTTYMSDSILLVVTYLFYLVYQVAIIVRNPTLSAILSGIFAIYRSFLTCGFIVYTLEFAPKIKQAKKSAFQGALFALVATQISDFFLFLSEKERMTNFVIRWIGSVGQLYLTHAIVLLLAIRSGHHYHAFISPDMHWRGFSKIALMLGLGAVWLVFSVYREHYAVDYDGIYQGNWIPVSYPYIYWSLCVGGGHLYILIAYMYTKNPESGARMILMRSRAAVVLDTPAPAEMSDPQQHPGNMLRRRTTIIGLDGLPREVSDTNEVAQETNSSPQQEHESRGLDFDILLVVITFMFATVYYTAEFYTSLLSEQYTTMAYYLTIPLAPIGLGAFGLVAWVKPPRRPKIGVYFAMLLTIVFLVSVMTFEDCHLSAELQICCEYPWLPDVNHEFTEEPPKPSCAGLLNEEEQCAAYHIEVLASEVEEGTSGTFEVIPLSLNAAREKTRGLVIDGYHYNNETNEIDQHFFSYMTTNVTDILQHETCQTKDTVNYRDGHIVKYTPGCYGEFQYKIVGANAEFCNPDNGNSCLFKVSTVNCAFKKSEPLWFLTTNINDIVTVGANGIMSMTGPLARDIPDSGFYMFFRLVGMSALLECLFTLFGIFLKLVFISECHVEDVKKFATVHHDAHAPHGAQTEKGNPNKQQS